MKRLLVLSSVFAMLSVGVFGCQRTETDDKMMQDDSDNGSAMEQQDDGSETATQKATITVEDNE